MRKRNRHLDAMTEEAIARSLALIAEALFIRYGNVGHASIEELGWLIEWPPSEDEPPRWWHPERGWTVRADRAIRYARKEDAEAAIKASRFGHGIATEHAWLSPTALTDGDTDA